MTRTRVLVVEDSATVRGFLIDCLHGDPEIEVIGEAGDGKLAIELCQRLQPDVITLDMMLPVMTGLSVTEYVMAYCPTPILIVSSSTDRGELFRTYEALAAGALDVLEKPNGDDDDGTWGRKFVTTVKLVARVKVITHVRAKMTARNSPPSISACATLPGLRCVAIGASTGGPQAVSKILGAIPTTFPLPILLVIHISTAFGDAFADWLDGQSVLPVTSASNGQPLPPVGSAGVILAPPDRHLVVRGNRLLLTLEKEVHSCRPSVDVLFTSIAQEVGSRAAAVLLTGMGRDGAAGLLAIRQAGGTTIAQDQESSLIFGMPREAIAIGAASSVLPLSEIAPALSRLIQPVRLLGENK